MGLGYNYPEGMLGFNWKNGKSRDVGDEIGYRVTFRLEIMENQVVVELLVRSVMTQDLGD